MSWLIQNKHEHSCQIPRLDLSACSQDLWQCDGCGQFYVVESSQRDGYYLVKCDDSRANTILAKQRQKREAEADGRKRAQARAAADRALPPPGRGGVHQVTDDPRGAVAGESSPPFLRYTTECGCDVGTETYCAHGMLPTTAIPPRTIGGLKTHEDAALEVARRLGMPQ